MKITIKHQLSGLLLSLALIIIIVTSLAYYYLLVQDVRELSRKQIRIAFELMFDDLMLQAKRAVPMIESFQQESLGMASSLNEDFYTRYPGAWETLPATASMDMQGHISNLVRLSVKVNAFAPVLGATSCVFYNKRGDVVAIYQKLVERNVMGFYLPQFQQGAYVSTHPSDLAATTWEELRQSEPKPLPEGIAARYEGELPTMTTATLSLEDKEAAIRIVAPIMYREKVFGVGVIRIAIDHAYVARYARFSQTQVNIFAGSALCIGTLPEYAEFSFDHETSLPQIDLLHMQDVPPLAFSTVKVEDQEYYQGNIILGQEGVNLGALTANFPRQIELNKRAQLFTLILKVAAALILFTLVAALWISAKVNRPLQRFIDALARLSKGEIPEKISVEYKGEFNNIKHNLNELIDATQEVTRIAEDISLGKMQVDVVERSEHDRLMHAMQGMVLSLNQVGQVAQAIATGDLTGSVQKRSPDDSLMQALNNMRLQLITVAGEVADTVNTVVKSSEELSKSAEALSQGTAQQAAATEEASASMEEMTANIRQNAQNSKQTEMLASQAVAYAEDTGQVVSEAVVAMQQIANQISVIQDIAQQTRLLSLNATIEASRAQDYGKAFTVVAHEVRDLANTTRLAAETIVQLTNSSLEVSKKAGAMLATLVPNIQETSELMQNISAANTEQSAGAEQVNKAMQQLDMVTQANAATAEEVAASAEMLARQATQLQQAIAFFTLPVEPALSVVPGVAETADSDLLLLLRTLTEKGASEQALGALVKSVITSRSNALETAAKNSSRSQASSSPPEENFALSVQSKTQRDALDDEYEHY